MVWRLPAGTHRYTKIIELEPWCSSGPRGDAADNLAYIPLYATEFLATNEVPNVRLTAFARKFLRRKFLRQFSSSRRQGRRAENVRGLRGESEPRKRGKAHRVEPQERSTEKLIAIRF